MGENETHLIMIKMCNQMAYKRKIHNRMKLGIAIK